MPRKRTDITGCKFGRLTVVSYGWTGDNRTSYWNCVCECGNSTTVAKCSLTTGRTISCGCFRLEQLKKATITHGLIKSSEYYAWSAMIQRCTNPSNEDKIKQNELHRKNGWQVSLSAYWFPYPMSNMTVEVCKHCGKATAVRMEVKVQ